jgi:hypothetical protein
MVLSRLRGSDALRQITRSTSDGILEVSNHILFPVD